MFLGVGSFEHTTAKNIENFKTYMVNQHCKSLDIATAITPNAGHGAALAQVMQNAIAFAYCKKHKEITIAVKDLQQYTGTYIIAGDTTKSKFKLYIADTKLYFANNGQPPIAFVPFAKDSFFMYENERDEIFFHTEAGKMYILYSPLHEKPTRLDKEN